MKTPIVTIENLKKAHEEGCDDVRKQAYGYKWIYKNKKG